jgi:hypothetical protein
MDSLLGNMQPNELLPNGQEQIITTQSPACLSDNTFGYQVPDFAGMPAPVQIRSVVPLQHNIRAQGPVSLLLDIDCKKHSVLDGGD